MCATKCGSKVKTMVPLVTSDSSRADWKGARDRKIPRHGVIGSNVVTATVTGVTSIAYAETMPRPPALMVGAAAIVAALGFSGCSPTSSDSAKTAPSPTAGIVSAPVAAALPPSEALTDVLNQLADPNLPGVNKVGLVEGATPEGAGTLEKFVNALRDNGYLPMTFTASNIGRSDKNPSDVSATVSINTARADQGVFTFPMEFAPYQGGWQLSRRTANMLLALGNSPGESNPTSSASPPSPAPPR